ncbi:MAG: endonuclease/exonuclease/phosphatase family protein [Cyanobacteria bacterium P01_A01_bin.135]
MAKLIALIAALAAISVGGCGQVVDLKESLPLPNPDNPSELSVVGFNLESGDAEPAYLAREYIAPMTGIDLWGLSEVQNEDWLPVLELGAESGEAVDYATVFGSSGGGDRLAIIYNTALLELIAVEEIEALSFEGRVRAPLVAQFQLRSSGQQLLFMVNHLYRSDAEKRHQQAQWLNEWGQAQSLPVIAVGDYNFDYDVVDGDRGFRDPGFDLMTAGDVFTWVRPATLTTTYCSDRYNSILDFIFVGGSAAQWPVTEVSVPYTGTGYCPDTPLKSDHFPVMASFDLAGVAP